MESKPLANLHLNCSHSFNAWKVISIPLVALALTTSHGAAAQQGSSTSNEIEEIVVTGSRLIRRDLSAPSPVVSIDADALA